jgi:ERCC4-type nuclease
MGHKRGTTRRKVSHPRTHHFNLRADGMVDCPFTVVIDTLEQQPYRFNGLKTNKDEGENEIYVPLVYESLVWGDYSILKLEKELTIERKSKADFLGSVARRSNFEERLTGMQGYKFSAVVVESEWSEIFKDRGYSHINLKSLYRTWLAWTVRLGSTRWYFLPGRDVGERTVYRLMERYWLDRVKRENLT